MVSAILNRLAPKGVIPSQLQHADFAEVDLDEMLFVQAMLWLMNEGLVHVEKQRGLRVFSGCQLSSRGYQVLGFRIETEDGLVTIEEAAKRVESSEGHYSKAGSFLGSLAGSFFKSMGS